MATPGILDIDALVAPISDETPTGPDLRQDPDLQADFYRVKDAREEARRAERRLEQAAEDEEELASIDSPNWRKVLEAATEVTAEKSKDLRILCWLIEALAREHGFAGLRDGFRLTRALVDGFWDDIHPRPDLEDDEGVDVIVAPLTGLNGDESDGALIAPIAAIPIIDGASRGPLSSGDYQAAARLAEISDPAVRRQRIDQGAVTLEEFEKVVREVPPEFFVNLFDDINAAIDEFAQLNQTLEEKCGSAEGFSAAPPSSTIRNSLEQCRDNVLGIARHLLEAAPEEAAETEGESVPRQATPAQLSTRDDALRSLQQVADYFRRTEPHSPVSYAVEQAVRWGRTPLPELLAELISEESVRRGVFERLGITPQESD